MFSSGQLIFALFFVIAFIIVMIISYRKDKQLNRKYFKGSKWILLGFVIFILILLAAKLAFKK
jgi:hypothetical membrane protein